MRPDRILRQLNDFFCEKLNMCSYMTCLIGIWNFRDNRLIYHNAGHPDLLCFHAETGEWFDPNPRKRGSLPVGMLREADYLESNNVELEFADDTVFLAHSDGLWDIGTHPNDQAGVDVKTFQQLASAAVKDNYVVEIPFRLSGALEQIGYDTPMDDYSLFALKKLSSEVGRTIFLRQIPPDMASIEPGHAGGGGIQSRNSCTPKNWRAGSRFCSASFWSHLQARARQLQESDRRDRRADQGGRGGRQRHRARPGQVLGERR